MPIDDNFDDDSESNGFKLVGFGVAVIGALFLGIKCYKGDFSHTSTPLYTKPEEYKSPKDDLESPGNLKGMPKGPSLPGLH